MSAKRVLDSASLINAVNDNLQKDSVSNQREHIIHFLANEQSRLRIPAEIEPVGFILFFYPFYHYAYCQH